MFRGSKPAPEESPPEPARNSKEAKAARRNSKIGPAELNPPAETPRNSRAARRNSKNTPEEVIPPAESFTPQEVSPLPVPPRNYKEARRNSKVAPELVIPPLESVGNLKEARRNSKNAAELVIPPLLPPGNSKDAKKTLKNAPEEVSSPPMPPSDSKDDPQIVMPLPVSRLNHAGLYKATFYSNIGCFFFGISMGWTGGAERSVMEHSSYDFTPSEHEWDCVCMLLTFGAMTWCLPMGLLLRAIGCRRTILVQLLPNTLGWCLTIWAQSISMLYAGRFILGMCGGAHCVAVPIYSAEISTVRKRGAMGVWYHGAYVVGVIYSFVLCSVVDLRLVNIINLGMLLFGLLQILMPESPVYYVNRGDIPGAEKTLRWLRGKDYDMSRELDSLTRETSESDHDIHRHPFLAFNYKRARRSLGRAMVLAMLQKLSGALIFILYCHQVVLCQGLQYPWIAALAVATVVGFLLCLILVDRVGRRHLLITSSAITFFASAIMCLGLKLWLHHMGHFLPWINLIGMTLFVGAYSVGIGALTWLLNVEMFVPPLRSLGCSISATISWLMAFISIFWYAAHKDICQPYFFLIFAIIAVITLLFTLVYIPETKGLSPRRIQQRMAGMTAVTFSSNSSESVT